MGSIKICIEKIVHIIYVENNNPESFWEGDTIELLPLDDLEDYIFVGWAPVVGSAIEGWNPGEQTENITLIAVWNERPKYKVTFLNCLSC